MKEAVLSLRAFTGGLERQTQTHHTRVTGNPESDPEGGVIPGGAEWCRPDSKRATAGEATGL